MRWKMFTLIAALMLVTTSASPSTVAAKVAFDETKKMRVALVVGVGTTQTLNLYVQYNMHRGTSQQSEPRIPGVTIMLQNPNHTDHEEVCRQTIHAQVNLTPGLLNTVTLGIRSGEEEKELLVNGVPEALLDDCFDETNRVVLVVGDFNDFQFEAGLSPASNPLERPGGIMIYDVTDPSGATAATGAIDLPQKFLTFEDENGDIR